MGDECKDCVQVKGLEDKIKALWHQVDESKGQRKDHEKRISDLEGNDKKTAETIEWIKSSIEEIKTSLSKIASTLETIQLKGAKTYDNLKYEAIKYMIVAVIAFAAAKIFQ